MARNQPPKEDPQPDDADASAAKGDVQQVVDRETEQGFVGTEVDPVPNEEYTLTTGPDSPSGVTEPGQRAGQTTRDEGHA